MTEQPPHAKSRFVKTALPTPPSVKVAPPPPVIATQPKAQPKTAADKTQAAWKYYHSLPAEHPHRPKLRQAFFDRYYPRCKREVEKYAYRKLPTYSLIQIEDLYQAVAIRLFETIPKFDPSFGIDFWQFFNSQQGNRSFLKGAIIDGVRALQNCTRRIAKQKRRLAEAGKMLRHALQREPTIDDFCDFFGWEHREELSEPMLWQSVFNQSAKPDGEAGVDDYSTESRFADASLAREEEIKCNLLPEGIQREKAILSIIKDDECRYAVWAYYWLGYTNKMIAKYLDCSISTALERKRQGEQIIAEYFTRESLGRIVENR